MTRVLDYALLPSLLLLGLIMLGRLKRAAVPLLICLAVVCGAAGIVAIVMTHWNSAITYLSLGFASALLARSRRRDVMTMPPS